MARLQQDKFQIFVSHKHADAVLANAIAEELEGLAPALIDCWVSGHDLIAGADWNRQIKAGLAGSHLLLLVFTTPARKWDWCLYEVGLFMRFSCDDITAVVCLYDPAGTTPGPLNQVQCVPAKADEILSRFLRPLCTETWRVSDDWQKGPLIAKPDEEKLKSASERISSEFCKALERGGDDARPDVYRYHPCHRIVLDLSQLDDGTDWNDWKAIPPKARVVEGVENTHSYTLSLFRAHAGKVNRTWGDLVAQVEGGDAAWRHDLDAAFAESLRECLWAPSTQTLNAWHPGSGERRLYLPVLYEVTRRQTDDAPVGLTILLVPT